MNNFRARTIPARNRRDHARSIQVILVSFSGIFHKTWVEVNEEGTEAAAATAAVFAPKVMRQPTGPPVIFRADHPFIFLGGDTRSRSALFIGRFADPGR